MRSSALLAALLATLIGCRSGTNDWVVPTPIAEMVGPQIRITGVVRYHEVEGGFYAIRGTDSVTYDPTNLPPEFRKDGLGVEAVARRRDDMMGIHQVGTMVQLERIRMHGGVTPGAAPQAPAGGSLSGTAWLLEDLAGAGVIDNARATLEFPEAGKAVGSGSCNRFFSSVTITGDSIKLGPIGSTRMACAEAVGNQERRYFEALEHAERYSLDGSALLIYAEGLDKPLRFTRLDSAPR